MKKHEEAIVRHEMIADRVAALKDLGIDVIDWASSDLVKAAVEESDIEIKTHMVNIAHNMDILGWDYCCPDNVEEIGIA
jgi:hypothetical protein